MLIVGSYKVIVSGMFFLSYLSEMDKNALRRKRYAEMSPDAKAALLCRRREARLVKKKDKSSRSYVRSVPFGHVETGVCFSGSAPAPAHNDQLPGCHHEVADGCPAVLQQSLDYMSTTIPAPLCLSSGTSSSAVVPHLVQCSLVSEGIYHRKILALFPQDLYSYLVVFPMLTSFIVFASLRTILIQVSPYICTVCSTSDESFGSP